MTCKDCLHYKACDRLADAKLGYGIMQVSRKYVVGFLLLDRETY